MKPFSKMDAVGFKKPVVTRDGTKVTIIGEGPGELEYPVVGYIEGSKQTDVWTSDGRYYKDRNGNDSDLDLFMASSKKKGYINIYARTSADEYGDVLNSTTSIFATEERAKETAKHYPAVAVAVPVEWEE